MNLEKTRNLKTMALLTGVLFAATVQLSQMVRAQEVKGVPTSKIANTLKEITANGTRAGAENSRVHILPTQSGILTLSPSVRNRTNFYGFKPSMISPEGQQGALPGMGQINTAFPVPGEWNPSNLVDFGGDSGNTFGLVSTNQTNIYLNCPAHNQSCWGTKSGDITNFQNNLAASVFIHINDQYVGNTSNNRYPLVDQWWADWGLNTAPWGAPTLLDSTAQTIAAVVATNRGNAYGYGNLYHIFVPNGTDVCFDSSYGVCYSPDHGSTFYFCGYHGSFNYNGNHILYSVEPYDPVPGCMVGGMTNTDAQVNVLSHETFEAITDPDPNFQWNSPVGLGEIGDVCAWNIYTVTLNTIKYHIQLEYSNKGFGCRAKT